MKITIKNCYNLDTDLQTQFIGNEVHPKPKYVQANLVKRTINQVYYEDIYLLEPFHYYYINLNENIEKYNIVKIHNSFQENGLLTNIDKKNSRIFIFNSSENIVYLQKNAKIGEVFING